MQALPRSLVWGLMAVVVAASLYAYKLGKEDLWEGASTGAVLVASSEEGREIPRTGYLTCLNGEAAKPGEAGCQLGFEARDGRTFALDMKGVQSFDGNYSATRKVWVLGSLIPRAGLEPGSSLHYDGVIAVRAIVANNK